MRSQGRLSEYQGHLSGHREFHEVSKVFNGDSRGLSLAKWVPDTFIWGLRVPRAFQRVSEEFQGAFRGIPGFLRGFQQLSGTSKCSESEVCLSLFAPSCCMSTKFLFT